MVYSIASSKTTVTPAMTHSGRREDLHLPNVVIDSSNAARGVVSLWHTRRSTALWSYQMTTLRLESVMIQNRYSDSDER